MAAKSKDDILDKVKKLLTLADKGRNNSAEEAESALMRAQQLMAEYDISIDEIEPDDVKYANEVCVHKWDLSWRGSLASVLASNFRCRVWYKGKSVVFMGHSTDARIAKEVFEYAYTFVLKASTSAYNKYYNAGLPTKGVTNSYVKGFISGLKRKLGEQSTALMIVVPPDVNEKYDEMTKGWEKNKSGMREDYINPDVFQQGVKDGRSILDRRAAAGE